MATSIDSFRDRLRIDKGRIDEELEIQAETRDHISRIVAARNTRMLELKDDLSRIEARLIQEIKENDPKMTNPLAEAEVKRRRPRLEAWDAYMQARQAHEEWSELLVNWTNRGYNLKTLADLYSAQYFSLGDSFSSRRHEPDQREERRRIREASEARQSSREAPIARRSLT